MFLPFMLRLLGGAVFPLFVLSVLSTPVFGVDALSLPKRGSGPVGLSVGLMLVRTSTQVYVWLGWAAYCASLALRYTSSPMVDNTAGYYGAAFLAANIPIAFLALKESAVIETDDERSRMRSGAALYRTITSFGFVVFCIGPQMMLGPYGWMVENIIPTDERIEVAELLREAALGDADAQHELGVVYGEGRLVRRDSRRAERWHLAAAEQGNRDSQAELCSGFLEGGLRESLTEAAEWCGKAAEQGDATAAFHLANMYATGEGVEQDRDTANRFYQAAAEGGIAEAQIVVGLDYADDGNVPIDLVQAYRWLTIASSRGAPGQDLTDVIELRERLRTSLTTDQLAEARRMVIEWQPALSSEPSQ